MNTVFWKKPKKTKVAILEDSHTYAHLVSATLLSIGLDTVVAYSLADFKKLKDWDYATCDLRLTDSDVPETAEWIMDNLHPATTLIVSGSGDSEAMEMLIKAGFDWIDKTDAGKVVDRLHRWFQK